MFNGTKFRGRPIAVDWAIPKKLYAAKVTQPSEEGNLGPNSILIFKWLENFLYVYVLLIYHD